MFFSDGNFNFNISCGLRPLENSRRRRWAEESEEYEDNSVNVVDSEDPSEIELDEWLYRKRGRIFGGQVASYGMYPWQAVIRRRLGVLGYHMHHCGGAIIGEYWILSAAHCFR